MPPRAAVLIFFDGPHPRPRLPASWGVKLKEMAAAPRRIAGEYRMRKLIIAGLVAAAQILPATQPATAAELHQDRTAMPGQVSAFAGARLRVPLGGREAPQAGLALTSTLRGGPDGQLRFARGAELGFGGRDSKLELNLGGRPVSQLVSGRPAPTGRKQGFSTAGWIAIGASAAIIVGGILIFDYIGDQSE
jgi:hypothetical protein